MRFVGHSQSGGPDGQGRAVEYGRRGLQSFGMLVGAVHDGRVSPFVFADMEDQASFCGPISRVPYQSPVMSCPLAGAKANVIARSGSSNLFILSVFFVESSSCGNVTDCKVRILFGMHNDCRCGRNGLFFYLSTAVFRAGCPKRLWHGCPVREFKNGFCL